MSNASRTLFLFDKLHLPWELVPDWCGPIWNGDRFTFEANDSYGEIGQFHELMHWIVADDIQRRQPDYGLGQNVGSRSGWRSSKWRVPEQVRPGAGTAPSWSNEDRVPFEKTAILESYAVWGMGLFSLLYPDAAERTLSVMDDFGAWSETFADGSRVWDIHDSAEIAALACPYLKIAESAAIDHLETVREHNAVHSS